MEMDKRIGLRINQKTIEKIKKIMDTDPESYPNMSLVVRAAIHYLHNFKLNGGKYIEESKKSYEVNRK